MTTISELLFVKDKMNISFNAPVLSILQKMLILDSTSFPHRNIPSRQGRGAPLLPAHVARGRRGRHLQ